MSRKTTTDAPGLPALMTVREVARLNGESERSVRRAIAAGALEAVRVGPSGRAVRIAPEALERYRRARSG